MEGWEGERKEERPQDDGGRCPCVQRGQPRLPLSQEATAAPGLPRAASALTARPPPRLRHTASP